MSAARRVALLLEEARDLLEGRIDASVPAWSDRRGWTDFLLALDDASLARCESEGLAAVAPSLPGLPDSLSALAAAARAVTELPELAPLIVPDELTGPAWSLSGEMREVKARKRAELSHLAVAVDRMARGAARIVDIGSGSGHFTSLAAQLFGRQTLGIERDPERVARAQARADQRAHHIESRGGAATFRAVDASREPLALLADDLAVGLHACGSLGDRLVLAAAETGCDVALVSCCSQKIEGETRLPLSSASAGLTLRRDILGLANLTSQPRGVETTIEATMDARQARFALLHLLRGRGLTVTPGEEMRGINRRRARGGLSELAGLALSRRGLSPATPAEIASREAEARALFARARRLSLPRNMLARPVEIAVVLDRAARLAESGHHVRTGTLFERSVTPRNIALLASRDPSKLRS
ncbi:MAG: methyltransferase [Polyangiaceae bacterium]